MKKCFIVAVLVFMVFLTTDLVQAQNTKWNNSKHYSKELKKIQSKSVSLLTSNHKDKKEEGIVNSFRDVKKSHPEEEGLCDLYIADFYMRRSNYPNYDSAIYYYMKADGKLAENMLYEQTVVYNNLLFYYVSQEDFDNAVMYACLSAAIDSAQCGNLARLCLFGGPKYFDPILAIDYCQAAMRMSAKEDLFPLIYCAQYIINTINDNTFDSVGFEYYRQAFIKYNNINTKEESAKFFENAAERKFFPAVVDLATFISQRKLYADKDQKEMCQRAVKMLQPLVDANYPPAAHAAGVATEYANLIMGGALVSASGFKEAYPYFEKGCALGYPPSITEVGRYHELNLGGLYGQHPEEAIQYYNAAEKEGYYQATNLKKAMASRAQLNQSVKDLVHSTVSLVEQTKRTKEMFESKEFAKKYNSKSIHKSSSLETAANSGSNKNGNKSGTQQEKRCKLCLGSGKCCGKGDYSQTLNNHYCQGSGVCATCRGEGILKNPLVPDGPGSYVKCSWCDGFKKCKYCGGSGRCSRCGGTGKN